MKKDYDFRDGRRGAIVPSKGKTRITIYLDDDVLNAFRDLADRSGRGYQTLINEALHNQMAKSREPVDATTLRRILREELRKIS
jgi:uncharacterized protein (DUF4415 family)